MKKKLLLTAIIFTMSVFCIAQETITAEKEVISLGSMFRTYMTDLERSDRRNSGGTAR